MFAPKSFLEPRLTTRISFSKYLPSNAILYGGPNKTGTTSSPHAAVY